MFGKPSLASKSSKDRIKETESRAGFNRWFQLVYQNVKSEKHSKI
jgi:hypothetical protein